MQKLAFNINLNSNKNVYLIDTFGPNLQKSVFENKIFPPYLGREKKTRAGLVKSGPVPTVTTPSLCFAPRLPR